jgi:hypothetical protein
MKAPVPIIDISDDDDDDDDEINIDDDLNRLSGLDLVRSTCFSPLFTFLNTNSFT